MRYSLRTLLIVVAALSIYLASYKAIMQPMIYAKVGSLGFVIDGHRAPSYRIAEPISRVVFWPAAWIDQRTRPGFWGPYSDFPLDKPRH